MVRGGCDGQCLRSVCACLEYAPCSKALLHVVRSVARCLQHVLRSQAHSVTQHGLHGMAARWGLLAAAWAALQRVQLQVHSCIAGVVAAEPSTSSVLSALPAPTDATIAHTSALMRTKAATPPFPAPAREALCAGTGLDGSAQQSHAPSVALAHFAKADSDAIRSSSSVLVCSAAAHRV